MSTEESTSTTCKLLLEYLPIHFFSTLTFIRVADGFAHYHNNMSFLTRVASSVYILFSLRAMQSYHLAELPLKIVQAFKEFFPMGYPFTSPGLSMANID